MANDAALLGQIVRSITGKCRVCHCGGESCRIGGGELCCWMDDMKTLCSNPRCIQVAEIQKKRDAREQKHRRVRLKARVA
jgi:hypothetical protein